MKKLRPSRSPRHLKWIRQRPCALRGLTHWHVCNGPIEAAHVRGGTDGGTGLKPSDFWSVPLCAAAHREQHTIGEAEFERTYGISLREIAKGLAALSPFVP